MQNKFSVYTETNISEYHALLKRQNLELDIYYQSEYLEFDAKIQKGEYEIFVLEEARDTFIFPYVKLFFEQSELDGYFDITSPYGYCGPFCTDKELFKKGEQLLNEYISEKCVTLFVRYHFLYNQDFKFQNGFTNLHNRTIVQLNLNSDWQNIWTNQFSGTNRNLVRKLEKEDYKFSIAEKEEDLNAFIEMYYSTMDNAGATGFYYFDKNLLIEAYKSMKEKILLTKIEKDGTIYCCALFFVSGNIINYYLSARNVSFSKVPATNFLLSKAAEYFHQKGAKLLNFGGGLTNVSTDALFKFKSNFSRETEPFFIGKKINNAVLYQQLIELFIAKNGLDTYNAKKTTLQFYRD